MRKKDDLDRMIDAALYCPACVENEAELTRLRAEVERLREFHSLADNHHNALRCPYCNPNVLTLEKELTALRAVADAAEKYRKTERDLWKGTAGQLNVKDAGEALDTALAAAKAASKPAKEQADAD